MKRLLIIEDDPGIRESLTDFFTGRSFVVDAVESAEAAAEPLRDSDFSALLLDVQLPGRSGLDLLRELRAADDETPIIILTARGEEQQRIDGLEAGADDYVVKPFSLRELAARLDAVFRRSPGVTTLTVSIGDAEVDLAAHEIVRGGRRLRLLTREAELLGYMLRNAGRTIERSELLQQVWGYENYPTTRTVDTHVLNLRKKLEPLPDSPRHLVTVHGVGYKLVL